MKRFAKNVLVSLLSLPGVNWASRWALRATSPKSAVKSRSNIPEIIRKDQQSFLGLLRRILPLSNDMNFSAGKDYIFRLRGAHSSELTRMIYWYGMPPMDFYPGSVVWRLAGAASSIIDVGANIGLYSLSFQQASPIAKIIAFEPASMVFETLKNNIELNHSRMEIYPYAIADSCGEITFYIPPTECDGSTRDALPDEAKRLNIPFTTTTVPAYTLDRLLSELKIERVDFIKLDTEGTEPAVMRRMKNILEKYGPDIFCEIVYGTNTEKALEDLLAPYKYNFYHLIDGELVYRDSIVPDVNKKHLNYLFSQKNLEEIGG